MDLQSLFDAHVFASVQKRLHLDKLAGDARWSFAMDDGLLRFGNRLAFSAQVLGTESQASATWLWGWANPASAIPDRLLRTVDSLKAWGAQRGIAEFTAARSPTTQRSGEWWGLLACGLVKAGACYAGAYDGGSLHLLITDLTYPPRRRTGAMQAANIMMQGISDHVVRDQRRAVVGYLDWLGWAATEDGTDIITRADDGQELRIAFDERGRIALATTGVGAKAAT
ncbi:MAG TPA: hypothetical protein VEL07_01630 [Planctomycetota bacterium]|nr:hypothetical protein [Planctomycetota bacterium]